MFPTNIHDLAQKVIAAYTQQNRRIVTAESCTGGLIGAALTSISGSSAVVERGFITYSNDAKTEVLGIMSDTIIDYGAVSGEVAELMAKGALEFSLADVAVSCTGVAGPTGGTPSKPVGLVYIGIATRDGALFHVMNEFKGERDAVRAQSVAEALRLLYTLTQELD